jgi:hypothetical protein
LQRLVITERRVNLQHHAEGELHRIKGGGGQ